VGVEEMVGVEEVVLIERSIVVDVAAAGSEASCELVMEETDVTSAISVALPISTVLVGVTEVPEELSSRSLTAANVLPMSVVLLFLSKEL